MIIFKKYLMQPYNYFILYLYVQRLMKHGLLFMAVYQVGQVLIFLKLTELTDLEIQKAIYLNILVHLIH